MKPIRQRFPGPWAAEGIPGGYVVRDASGAPLAYFYAPSEGQRSAMPGRTLTNAEARALARAFAALNDAPAR